MLCSSTGWTRSTFPLPIWAWPSQFSARARSTFGVARGACQSYLQPLNTLPCKAPCLPIAAEKPCEPQELVRTVWVGGAPCERRQQIVVLDIKKIPPLLLIRPLHPV
jgi:hypothetical protein